MSRINVPVVMFALALAAPGFAQQWQPPEWLSDARLGETGWVVDCETGDAPAAACDAAASAAQLRNAWDLWAAAPSAASPFAAIELVESGLVELTPAAAAACGVDAAHYRDRVDGAIELARAARRLDAVRLSWVGASEGLLVPPSAAAGVDELTSVFGIGTYCGAEQLHALGRWGRLRITVGEHSLRMIQNPLERLLMCSNFLSIVGLQVSETGPEVIFPPMAAAGLLAEPYASMSAAEWSALLDSPEWQAIIAGIPADRIWWEMVDHPDEQIAIWTRALASGFIDAPAAFLYGARTIGSASRPTLSRALADEVTFDAAARVLGGIDIAFLSFIDGYRSFVPEDFVVDDGADGLAAILANETFRDAFLDALAGGRYGAADYATRIEDALVEFRFAAMRIERALACPQTP